MSDTLFNMDKASLCLKFASEYFTLLCYAVRGSAWIVSDHARAGAEMPRLRPTRVSVLARDCGKISIEAPTDLNISFRQRVSGRQSGAWSRSMARPLLY